MALAEPPAHKEKTKAKARYLKRKKQRRKLKVNAQSAEARARKAAEEGAVSSDEEEEGGRSSPIVVKDDDKKDEDERPHKRQKVEESENGSDTEDAEPEHELAGSLSSPPTSDESDDEHDEIDKGGNDNSAAADELLAPPLRSTTPQVGLPSFPLPVAPDAPSKSQLALQGLDKAFLNAELIDPNLTVPIDAIDAGRALDRGELPVLSERIKKRLGELDVNEFFAIQGVLLPFLLPAQRRLRALYTPYDPPRDVCASAPTGSGKTLAYVVPIVEILSTRIATRLRALIVLPTRDLVTQVQETFEAVCKGRGLKIGVATGQHSFAHEQAQLVDEQDKALEGGSSKVDILICTPGRLIDHLDGTRNFTLQHLRFLVIDEADRLLAQSFQDWLAQVLAALRPPVPTAPSTSTLASSLTGLSLDNEVDVQEKPIPYHDGLAPTFLPSLSSLPHIATDFDDVKYSSCQKLLFSATLTRDPARIAALGLRDAKYFIVQSKNAVQGESGEEKAAVSSEGFAMPTGLKEHYIVTHTSQKPLMLFHLVHSLGITNALVFTKSAESTARLVKLFNFFESSLPSLSARNPVTVRAYSSDLPTSTRTALLAQFKSQNIDILICSDLVARGIDVAHVAHVVSYDAPIDLRKYVHRVGRTARAGRMGDAWTLVEEQEARHFKKMMRDAGRLSEVKKVKVTETELEPLVGCYDAALGKLKEAYNRTVS